MGQFDWKKKFSNKTFVITITTTSVAFIYQILAIAGVTPKVSQDSAMQLLMLVINALAALGIVIDPNTNGITDEESEEDES